MWRVAVLAVGAAGQCTRSLVPDQSPSIRGYRYCEILTSTCCTFNASVPGNEVCDMERKCFGKEVRTSLSASINMKNGLGDLDTCPDVFGDLTGPAIQKAEKDASGRDIRMFVKNGPRTFIVDEFQAGVHPLTKMPLVLPATPQMSCDGPRPPGTAFIKYTQEVDGTQQTVCMRQSAGNHQQIDLKRLPAPLVGKATTDGILDFIVLETLLANLGVKSSVAYKFVDNVFPGHCKNWREGKEIYVLTSPAKQTFVMQSFSLSRVVGKEEDLATLGPKLDMPEGWTYSVMRATAKICACAGEEFKNTYTQDEFKNTYLATPVDGLAEVVSVTPILTLTPPPESLIGTLLLEDASVLDASLTVYAAV